MVGIVLGLGFQWWPSLHLSWQFIAFIFVYFDIIDYWIDYAPSLKKFPPKREVDVFLDIGIIFSLFLYIYSTQLTIVYFLTTFITFKILDYFWLLSSKYEYRPEGTDRLFVDTWMYFNLFEVLITGILIGSTYLWGMSPLTIIGIFIILRIVVRISASFRYKKIRFS